MGAERYGFSSSKAWPVSRGTPLSPREEDLESAETHALHVEGHRLLDLRAVHARVFHHLRIDAVAMRARLVHDPGEDRRPAGLESPPARERTAPLTRAGATH